MGKNWVRMFEGEGERVVILCHELVQRCRVLLASIRACYLHAFHSAVS